MICLERRTSDSVAVRLHASVCSVMIYSKQNGENSFACLLGQTILGRNYLIAQQLPASSPGISGHFQPFHALSKLY